jgi:hypothetical protein
MGNTLEEDLAEAVKFLQLHRAVDIIVEKDPIVIKDTMPLCGALKFLAKGEGSRIGLLCPLGRNARRAWTSRPASVSLSSVILRVKLCKALP